MNLETISTERLLLKKITPQELKLIFRNYAKEEVKSLLGLVNDEQYTLEKQKSDQGHTSYNRTILLFLLVDKVSGNTIGRCGFHNWLLSHQRAELGYVLSAIEDRQKGLMSEALKAIIDYGFSVLNLHRIEAMTSKDNFASIRLLEKNGFTKEAVLREHFYADGIFYDSVVFSKLKIEHS